MRWRRPTRCRRSLRWLVLRSASRRRTAEALLGRLAADVEGFTDLGPGVASISCLSYQLPDALDGGGLVSSGGADLADGSRGDDCQATETLMGGGSCPRTSQSMNSSAACSSIEVSNGPTVASLTCRVQVDRSMRASTRATSAPSD